MGHTLHYTYPSGERIGYVQKISQKGWLWHISSTREFPVRASER
jgi:hypothetical protein